MFGLGQATAVPRCRVDSTGDGTGRVPASPASAGLRELLGFGRAAVSSTSAEAAVVSTSSGLEREQFLLALRASFAHPNDTSPAVEPEARSPCSPYGASASVDEALSADRRGLLEEWETMLASVRAAAAASDDDPREADSSFDEDRCRPQQQEEGAGPDRLASLEDRLRAAQDHERRLAAQHEQLRIAALEASMAGRPGVGHPVGVGGAVDVR